MTDTRRLSEQAVLDLEETANWWDEVLADRFPGTRRRWHQRRTDELMTATHDCGTPWAFREPLEIRDDTGEIVQTFRRPYCPNPHCNEDDAIGFSPSPARDSVLDIVAQVTWSVVALRDEVASKLNAGDRKIGVAAACRWIATAVPGIADQDLVRHITTEAAELVNLVRLGTGRAADVIHLDANCPICGKETLLAYVERMSVTCADDECRCDQRDCPCQRGRKHTWPENDLVWLARLIGVAEEEAS